VKAIPLILPLLLVTACVKGPDYQRPDLGSLMGGKFKRSTKADASAQPLPDEWWKAFNSSKLNALVSQAIAGNQDLAAAEARVATSRALIGASRADWFPQLESTSSIGLSRQSEAGFAANLPAGFGGVSDLLRQDRYKSALNMSYEVDLWGRVKRSVESAKAKAQAADETLAAQRLMLAAEVAQNYFLLRSLDAQVSLLRDTISLRAEAQKLQQSRLDGGLANEMDVTRARTEHELAKADLAVTERQRGSTEHALAVLCGSAPGAFSVAPVGQLTTPPNLPAGMPSTLLQSRPDIRAAEAELQAASADIGVAEASFFPRFQLLGSGGLESVKGTDLLNWQNRVLSIGPGVSAPILQGGRLKSNLRAAQSRYDEALAKYKQTALSALREVEDSLLDLRSYTTQHNALAAAQKSAAETAALARIRYGKGLASYFEVVEADRTVLSTKLALAQLDGQRYVSTVLLAKALGGGWKR
jgi:multidrug efflux system outer membrane protein